MYLVLPYASIAKVMWMCEFCPIMPYMEVGDLVNEFQLDTCCIEITLMLLALPYSHLCSKLQSGWRDVYGSWSMCLQLRMEWHQL